LLDQGLRMKRRYAEIQDERLSREAVNTVLEMLDPGEEFGSALGRGAGGLVCEIRTDVPVGEHDLACVQRSFKLGFSFEAITRVEQGSEMRIDAFKRAEFAIEELADHAAEPGIVLRKSGGINRIAAQRERLGEQIDLRALAAAVDPFDGDEFSASGHEWKASLTGDARHCKETRVRILQRSREPSMNWDHIRENLGAVQERIAAAARRAGRPVEEITLIAVSKTHPVEAIRAAHEAGVRHFGENRVQEWEGKLGGVANLGATWHLIGHLQSNKSARAAKAFSCVDSVDDFGLAQRLDRAREELEAVEKLRVLLEVRVAQEETKNGVEIPQLAGLAERVAGFPRLDLAGLMCIPPYLANIEELRPYFRKLRELRDDLQKRIGVALPVLSMGMSHDLDIAIEEGATEVRVGTAIFGMRALQ
jgi:pyridoxal phosphate enzyme (YggS family)